MSCGCSKVAVWCKLAALVCSNNVENICVVVSSRINRCDVHVHQILVSCMQMQKYM